MSGIIVGIDLGTTNSEVAVLKDGKIEVLELDNGSLLPSVVGLDENDEIIVGSKARNQYLLYPERTIRSIKRKMGTDEDVLLGEKTYTPQEISAIILMELKKRAEAFLGESVGKAVITVPAYFSDAQRQATRDAGQIAGLEVVRVINEPTAACLAFEQDETDARKNLMAFDLGGGTFDVSIVKMEGDLVEVVGSHGDTHLGGDDIDEVIHDMLMNRVAQKSEGESFELDAVSNGRLLRAAEDAKIRLSQQDFCRVVEDNLNTKTGEVLHFDEELTRDEGNQMLASLLERTLDSVNKAMEEANVSITDIDDIILVGGSTRLPLVPELLEDEYGKKPRKDVHPDLAVVYGAGVMAARMQGAEQHRVLIDITPYTFGTSSLGMLGGEMVHHLFVPIIEAGTPLPAVRSKTFYTISRGQEAVAVEIFQGENEYARENILLGDFRVEGLDPQAPLNSPVVIQMSLDLDGILHVQATEKNTGLSKDIRIENSLGKMNDMDLQQARQRMAEIFGTSVDGHDEVIDAELVEEAPTTRDEYKDVIDLIARVEKMFDAMDEVDREDANTSIANLRQKMEGGDDTDKMKRDMEELEDLLFYLDTAE